MQREEGSGDLIARNPGQQWSAEFDGKGFTITPDQGTWTWGLDLTGYAGRTLPASPSQLRHEGGKITCQRDENLTEWFINDTRGVEQGWDIRQRPERADPTAPLQLHLTSRGGFRPQVSEDGTSVSFQEENGGSALTYGGLKAWDAEGKTLTVRFEQAGGNDLRIAVDDRHARYPITIDPVVQQAYLKASNAGGGDYFGLAVAISGDTVVVAAHSEDSAAAGVNGDQANNAAPSAGAVYVFVRSGNVWAQQAYLKASNPGSNYEFGASVAISGDTLVVGSPWEASAATGVNGNQADTSAASAGSAYIFTRSGTTWAQQAYLKASNTGANDGFGRKVAISGDTVLVGASGEDSNATGVNGNQTNDSAADAGAAYIFTRNGTTWSQQAYLKASNAETGDLFGCAVGVSGDTVVVGAYAEDSTASGVNGDQSNNSGFWAGAAYIFVRSGTAWTQEAYLKASNAEGAFYPWTYYNGDQFGEAVAISGDTVVIGTSEEDSNATGVNGNESDNSANSAGAAYVFARNGTVWSQQAYLKASNSGALHWFGEAVDISGDTIVVGAPFFREGGFDRGAAYAFTRSGTAWTQSAFFQASNPGGISFARAVGISGETVICGAYYESSSATGVKRLHRIPVDSNGSTSGAAYITHLNQTEPLPADISVRMAAVPIPIGGTATLGPAVTGTSRETSFEIASPGPGTLELTGTPRVAVSGSSDFTVSAQPDPGTLPGPGGSTTFKVLFTPTSGGTKSAALSILNNDGYNSNFVLNLTAPGLSFVNDTDGDGMSDASEYNMPALNFDWQVAQTALVNTYLANANGAGLYAPSQVQALRIGTPSMVRLPANGRFKLTMDWKKATNLTDFSNFPAPSGSSVSISPSGGIEFEFPSPDNAALFRIENH